MFESRNYTHMNRNVFMYIIYLCAFFDQIETRQFLYSILNISYYKDFRLIFFKINYCILFFVSDNVLGVFHSFKRGG